MKRVIHIGDGRHIEIEEGELKKLPPAPKAPRYAHRPEPLGRKVAEQLRANRPPVGKGRAPNQAIGMTKAEALLKTEYAHEQALRDMKKIKDSGVDLTAAGEEALVSTLTIMRANGDVRVQLAAARQVLEWSRAKPAASTNVNVNTAEDWLASLSSEDNDKNDAEGDS